jgi:hypothetical protein
LVSFHPVFSRRRPVPTAMVANAIVIRLGRWCRVPFVKGLPPVFAALAGLLSLVLPGRPGRASEAPGGAFTFTWDAPAECPSREQVEAEIARLLGQRSQIAQGGDLDAHATVEHGAAWSVSLTTQHAGRAGRRSLDAPSCRSVAEATALIIALMIDPDAVAANAPDRKEEPASVPMPAAEVTAPDAWPLGFSASLHAQGSLGTLPEIDVGVGAGVGLAGRRWRLELRGTYGLRRNQASDLPSVAGAYGRFNLATGALAGCYRLGSSGLGFGPCAVVEAGVVSAEGHGASVGFSKHAPWAALGGGGYLSLAMGRHLCGSLEFDVLFPVYRPSYVFQDLPGVVFQAPAVGLRALAGMGWRF